MWIASLSPAHACPAFLELDGSEGWVGQVDLSKIHLFAFEQKKGWSQLSLQAVPVNAELGYDSKRIADPTITSRDRLMFETSGFSSRADAKVPLPCGATRSLELNSPAAAGGSIAHAYLVECQQHPKIEIEPRNPVTVDPAKRLIKSAEYLYTYHPRNELLYESLIARTSTGEMVNATYKSDVAIRLDIKRFFTLEFDNSDVESYVMASQAGPVGLVEGVSFFLRLLAFKIDLKLSTIASFFEKSANIPMLIDVPRNGPDVLHRGSASLYSFKIDKASLNTTHPMSTMPVYKGLQTAEEQQAQTKAVLERCAETECRFRLMGNVEKDIFAIDMKVPRNVVEMGFYPVYVEDVGSFRKAADWKKDPRADGNSRAFVYETSGLAKGRYKIDTWILFGQTALSPEGCPAKAAIIRNL